MFQGIACSREVNRDGALLLKTTGEKRQTIGYEVNNSPELS
jgi:hypothetical protein